MKRSASISTTLSQFSTRKSKFRKWLALINVFIMISSLIFACLGLLFMYVFHMNQIYSSTQTGLGDLWYFYLLPYLLIGIGSTTLVLSTVGFVFSAMESRIALIIYAVLMSLLAIFQLFFIYVTFKANGLVEKQDQLFQNRVETAVTNLYMTDVDFRGDWDNIQSDMRCCGFGKDKLAFTVWTTDSHISELKKQNPEDFNECFPKSCLIDDRQLITPTDCTNPQARMLYKKINMRGCLPILETMYQKKLPRIFLFIEIYGALTIIAEITIVALASAFVGQITRRTKRYEMQNIELKP